MKIIITNNEKNVGVIKDLEDMESGLIGQVIMELELIKQELLEKYSSQ